MDQQGGNITLLWVPANMTITSNEIADRSQRSSEQTNKKHRKVFSPSPHKMDRKETSREATRKIEQLERLFGVKN
jgi:hypothetical protein